MIIVEGDAPWNLSSATSAQTELNEMELKTCANETDLFSSSNDLYTTSQGMFQSASQGFIWSEISNQRQNVHSEGHCKWQREQMYINIFTGSGERNLLFIQWFLLWCKFKVCKMVIKLKWLTIKNIYFHSKHCNTTIKCMGFKYLI